MLTVGSPLLWVGFLAFVLAMLALDLGVFHRRAHTVSMREALGWTAVWISLALVFGAGVWWQFGKNAGLEFLTGYLVEKALSVDNIFVFVLIFTALRIPPLYQHRVLYWGILSALALRAAMIFAGVALLERFHWLIYGLGVFLIVTGIKLLVTRSTTDAGPSSGWLLRAVRRILPVSPELDGGHFVTRRAGQVGRWVATPLLLALVLVEVSDVIFALDSIPAIFGVTRDPFIVFTSNVFAILGLRSLYFALASVLGRFRHLKFGLGGVLAFVGAKMVLADRVPISPGLSLGVIALLLALSIVTSLLAGDAPERPPAAPPRDANT
jgi:tellurite resistance protein TerC